MSYKYCVASYTHFLKGKHTTLGGPAVALSKYLGKKAYFIWQPIPAVCPVRLAFFLKIRDIWLVLAKHKPAPCFIGVEALNALLGRFLGYSKVIYLNLDYSPTRGRVWSFFDRLAIKYADEVWVLKDRGLPKQKIVPIGCWFKEIKRLPLRQRDKRGIVYIGLLEEMQGVGMLIEAFNEIPDARLTIIGTGKDENKFKKMADSRVKFTGLISDKEAQKILCKNIMGWAVYHPDNPTIKTTAPTKPITYASCGLIVLNNLPYSKDFLVSHIQWAFENLDLVKTYTKMAEGLDWNVIFKEALCLES
jgi:glycosyltransferase involved in cell wall biosynthesis